VSAFSRPKRGLPPAEALARWSDPDLYKELVQLAETTDLPTLEICGNVIRDPDRCKEYRKKRTFAEDAFNKRLQDGEIFSSVIAKFSPGREVLHPSLFDVMIVAHDYECVLGNGTTYEKAEFFELSGIPLNIMSIPPWLDDMLSRSGQNVFRHSRDYRHIHLHGNEFALSPLHANIVKVLHEGFLAGEPWMLGPKILEDAGSDQTKLGDAFKSREDWRMFIDSDGKGMHRLRMEPPKDEPGDR
jgi:hypothetical protein